MSVRRRHPGPRLERRHAPGAGPANPLIQQSARDVAAAVIGINAKVPDHPARGGEARADGSRGRLQLDVKETDRLPIERNQLDAGIGVIGLRASTSS
jgi:hypothetical protein